MRLFLSGLTLILAAWLIVPDSRLWAAPKPPDYTGATVQFRDWTGDAIMSDGAVYIDGEQRDLAVRMWIRGSQDLTIGTFQSGRTIQFSYAPATDVTQPTENPPSGSLVDNAFVNIRNIASMPVSSTKITRASFNTAIGYFRWLSGPNPSTGVTTDPSYGSQAVVVTRTSATTWDVHTPVPAESGYWDGVPTQVSYTAGDLSVLLKTIKNKLTPIGLYHLPFGLTVTCPNCS